MQSEHTAIKLGKCAVFLGFGKLNALSKAFGCPHFIQSVLHGWVIWQHRNVLSGIWEHCLRWQKVLTEGLGAIIWDRLRKQLWPGCRGWRLFP